MNRRTSIQVIAGIVVAVFAVGLWGSGVAVEASWLRFYSLAVLVAGVLWIAWDRWLWRLPIFKNSESVSPVLHGTWRGLLTSLWPDPATGLPPDPKTAYLVVRQTASSLSVTFLTEQAQSASTLAQVQREAGTAKLLYVYLASPDPSFEESSRMHHGSAMLTITGSPARRLRGRYWTDRDSRGELDFTERVAALAGDIDEASALFDAASP